MNFQLRAVQRLVVTVGLLVAASTGCGDDDKPATQPSNNGATDNNGVTNNGATNNGVTDNNGATDNNGMTNNGGPRPQCEVDEDCREDRQERCLSDGTCAGRWDRRCVGQEDCRAGETCTEIDANAPLSVCIRAETPIEACPGGTGCGTVENAVFRAGASKKTITPPGFELPLPEFMDDVLFVGDPDIIDGDVTFRDCGLDQLCEGDPGYTAPDFGEDDGHMQGAWLAGFDHSRPAFRWCEPDGHCPDDSPGTGALAHDDIWARTVVFEQGETRVALVVVDTVGYFYDESPRVRALLGPETEIDLLLIASTHNHEGPDTMGQWGPGVRGDDLPISTGAERWWLDYVAMRIAESVEEAVGDLQPASVRAAMGDTGTEWFGVQDSRDPWIFDDDLAVMQLRNAETDAPIATLINWGNHAESLSDENQWITSDYPGPTRDYLEQGLPAVEDGDGNVVAEAIEGTGGVAVYVMGSVGGLVTPLRGATARNRRGEEYRSGSWGMADAMGQQLAGRALELLRDAPTIEPSLSFASREITMPVENTQFHTAIIGLQLFDRDTFNMTTQRLLEGENTPLALTRVSVLRVGAVSFFTVPGEVFPETVTGGFDPAQAYPFTPVRGNPSRLECGDSLVPYTCATTADCPDNWSCHAPWNTCLPEPAACTGDETCGPLSCLDGRCQRACADETTCGEGFVCAEGRCAFDLATAVAAEAVHPCMINPRNENPPDLGAAPSSAEEPPLKEQMPGDVVFLVGMGHDELGYIVPPYDFKLADEGAYLLEAPGHHYEETNSVGPRHLPILRQQLRDLLDALP